MVDVFAGVFFLAIFLFGAVELIDRFVGDE